MRALLLPGFFLACDLLLVVAGRSSLIGPIIGYEFRYISELSAVTAAALAFATMPVRGAVEQVQPRRPSVLLDRRRPAAVACLVVALLGTSSTAAYYRNWIGDQPGKAFFSTLVADSRQLPRGTAVVDSQMPPNLLWPLAYPYNTLRVLLRPLDPGFRYATEATDQAGAARPGRPSRAARRDPRAPRPAGHRPRRAPTGSGTAYAGSSSTARSCSAAGG